MQKIAHKSVQMFNRLRGFFPKALPTGMTELNAYTDWILETYDLPKFPSYRQSVAAMIMHLGTHVTAKPPRFFARGIKKAMANQVAYEVIQEIRQEEKKKNEAVVQSLTQEAKTDKVTPIGSVQEQGV